MAILVSFFHGDSATIRRCLASGGWPPEDAENACEEEVGFKFGVMPEQAFDSLIVSAAQLTEAEPFRFQDCVNGTPAEDGESFQGTVTGRFIGFFADFPADLVPELGRQWTTRLHQLYETEYSPGVRRKTQWFERVGSGIQAGLFGAVMLPVLGICMLSPSFRRERARNRKNMAERKAFTPKTNDELISELIGACISVRERHDELVYTWSI